MYSHSNPKIPSGHPKRPSGQGDPASRTADACFESMARHAQRNAGNAQASAAAGDAASSPDAEGDLAWGASEAAAIIFGVSRDPKVNRRRRRRVFIMYEAYRKAVAEAMERKKPLPTNPGWVILPRCARIILSKRAYRAFVDAQLEGKR